MTRRHRQHARRVRYPENWSVRAIFWGAKAASL
jgi:hypothetical protein